MSKFFKVKTYSNYCFIDYIEEDKQNKDKVYKYKDFVPGKYLVRFPDESEEVLYVNIEKTTLEYSDMGKTYSGMNHKIYISTNFHGIPMKIYLRDTKVKLSYEVFYDEK